MTRTLLRIIPLAAVIALAVPCTADAQSLNVRRTEHAPEPRTPAQQADFAAAAETLSSLFDAQRAHYASHRRFAASLEELAELEVPPGTTLAFAAEADWYVATVGDGDIGIRQHVVTLYERDRAAANAVGEAQRVEATGVR